MPLKDSEFAMRIDYDKTVQGKDADGSTPIVGTVNMEKYAQWLKANYKLTLATAP